MARINIEDDLLKDNRFIKLCFLLGSRRLALGAICEAWMFAQTYVTPENPKALIPIKDWEEQEFAQEIITVKLGCVEGESIYLSGAEEQFKWLVQKYEAGRRGGRPSKGETERLSNGNRTPTGSNPLSPSLPLSHNKKNYYKKKPAYENDKPEEPDNRGSTPLSEIIGSSDVLEAMQKMKSNQQTEVT